MTKKIKPEPSIEEARKRLKEYAKKAREKFPAASVNEDEPLGPLAGNPDKIKDEFEDDFGKEKPDLKTTKTKHRKN